MPVAYDPAAVGRVAARVEIVSVELIDAFLSSHDSAPLPTEGSEDDLPVTGVGAIEWQLSVDGDALGVTIAFIASSEADPAPYQILAQFRLTYTIADGDALNERDVTAFVHWNSVFNAWPYWREYLSSTLSRTRFQPFTAPVMGVPRSIADPQG
jgi:hypothetical protein